MKIRLMVLALALPSPLIAAEPASPQHWPAAELAGYAQSLKSKVDANNLAIADRLFDQGSYYTAMVHREPGNGVGEIHREWADIYFVSSGTGTLITGGSIPGAAETTPGEIRGPAIEGGTRQELKAGDVVHIPAGTPHNVMVATGNQITYFIVKVKAE